MIYVGIDDTDTLETPGTNQLARALVDQVSDRFRCQVILRHQLLFDPRVPYTSKNGSASIQLVPLIPDYPLHDLIDELQRGMQEWFKPGSDPGLCVTTAVPNEIIAFGRRCQTEIIEQTEARALAEQHGIYMQGIGGTEDGVIGALAAIGLAASNNDGRAVQIGVWPDDLTGVQELAVIRARCVHVLQLETELPVTSGLIDVGKHLRPNLRAGRIVLFVTPEADGNQDVSLWKAVRLP